MTSFTFILGVFPLVIATGAGGGARRSIGLPVFSGMIASTCLVVVFVRDVDAAVRGMMRRRLLIRTARSQGLQCRALGMHSRSHSTSRDVATKLAMLRPDSGR